MSSGTLPLTNYHRASSLGAGSYGSVVTVYNEDGEEYALKVFADDDDDDDDDYEDSDDDSDDEEYRPKLLDLGTLREISILRLLRGENAHPNIVPLVDVYSGLSEDAGEQGLNGTMSIALPLYKNGSLFSALEKKYFDSCHRRVKVSLAHGILSAVAYLHDNGILHRDIKTDNIMIEHDGDGWKPILIDFSLAKLVQAHEDINGEPIRHSKGVGTVTYTAPEVMEGYYYGHAADLYSVGVVLFELLMGEPLAATKDKHGRDLIEKSLEALPQDQPFPNLLRGLLHLNPKNRLTARQALAHPLFSKFGLGVPNVRRFSVAEAMPLSNDDSENSPPENITTKKSQKGGRKLSKRETLIKNICEELECESPMTARAALEYSRALAELDEDIDDLSKSQGLLHSCVLASRFYELDIQDLDDLDENDRGLFEYWSRDEYIDEESTILMLMDYCLYARNAET